ncbi:hypothetical protein A3E04_00730 [Candidatus Kuenenbacteria bacterium RIFCSPHIGHO2_12_FULL_42_14]|uniref:Glutamyl-tRNA amidotransferase n=3 Tax=Candidatus Kueneniibacteriota TaxID=1752740 RepID=A0A0G0YY30_9BACT|nr:MAG: hypothetical protein UV02_C0026G0003 [Candidatus Kuenenbacteria bacterium GW2011_GWA2_42_15]OGG91659.1 MAG: hypothetical protein A3H55_02615 [Candidatus Kuenenbacteria bacterium RIFCSPLOWO2_02_FULL_42_16]OGG98582.1 MAG: hypothetical protein A3E04_00730 [Candidatus Kuenenbacteria bacterium RIFCSPHIGHO2_12_FULL_42_14]
MNLLAKLEADFRSAMIARDSETVALLRLLKAALKNEMISLIKPELTDEETTKVLKREAKKRADAIELYLKGGRQELADKEKVELALIKKYLPAGLSEADIQKITKEVIAEMGSVSPSQFGMIMKAVMAKTKGQADGAVVSRVVKELLS